VEAQRQRSELVQVIEERDQSRGRAAEAESCNTPGVTQGVHTRVSPFTHYHLKIELGKVYHTWNSRS
jgi:hypothetical protein